VAKDLKDRVEEILRGLDDGTYEQYGDEETELQGDIDTIAELLEDMSVGERAIEAALRYWESSGASVEVWELKSFIREHYRGQYTSAAVFAREEEMEYFGGSRDKLEILEKYSEWIDWEGYAESPDMSDFTFVTLPNSTGVFVFRDYRKGERS